MESWDLNVTTRSCKSESVDRRLLGADMELFGLWPFESFANLCTLLSARPFTGICNDPFGFKTGGRVDGSLGCDSDGAGLRDRGDVGVMAISGELRPEVGN